MVANDDCRHSWIVCLGVRLLGDELHIDLYESEIILIYLQWYLCRVEDEQEFRYFEWPIRLREACKQKHGPCICLPLLDSQLERHTLFMRLLSSTNESSPRLKVRQVYPSSIGDL